MANETNAAPAAPATDQRDSKSVTNNIIAGIQNKAGRGGSAAQQPPINDAKQPAAPPDPNAGKERYVVDGKEVWVTPQERTAWVQKGMAFEPRMDQLARLQQETTQLQRALINDPLAVLKNIATQTKVPLSKLYEKILDGDWPDEVKEIVGKKYYHNAVEPLNMTPEQLKAREDAKYREQREQQDKMAQENMVRQENQKRFQQAQAHISAQIAEAMKESGLPNNDSPIGAEMAWMVAKTMQLANKRQQPMTPKQAIEIVKRERIMAVQTAYYDTLADKDDDGDELAKAIGEKAINKIKKFLLKQAKGPQNPPIVPDGQLKPSGRPGERKTINSDDFHDYLDSLKRGNTFKK